MFLLGWTIWCVLLALCELTWGLEVSGYGSDEVICPQFLYDCTSEDEMSLTIADREDVEVKNLNPHIKLCCKDKDLCTICLWIDADINIHPDGDVEDEGYPWSEEEDYHEDTRNPKASVTVCYSTAATMPLCKKVEFTVNHTDSPLQNQAKISVVIAKPTGISFGSRVIVYTLPSHLLREVLVPSLTDVCSHDQQEQLKECRVPRLKSVINQETNEVELLSADGSETLPSVCIQHEHSGRCQRWNSTTVPLYAVTSCMCFQVWDKDSETSRRSRSCPFRNSDFSWRNVWQNVSVSVDQGQTNDQHLLLWWNLSAPCRLEGEVWPCHKVSSCQEIKGFRQQLTNGTWRQNLKGQWEKTGVFKDIDLQFGLCVMVEVKGMEANLGPFCYNNTERTRWSLLIVCLLLLACATVLISCLLHAFVKKWVWSWRHGGFVKIGRRHHVVLLSPPDMDDGVSESVCQLGSLLCSRGFSVSVDQWSRKQQCRQGPLPWLHSQLLELDNCGGRAVLVLSRRALERADEWTLRNKDAMKTKSEEKGQPQPGSPYSDVFMASLFLIQADRQLGRAGKRFLLVNLDSNLCSEKKIPEPLQGLTLFQLPAQTKAFLTELTL
ncbi:interleukin-17 receptor C isoform X2 [Antennarius striatus]|uniref:interleukin-17 receptor C isoform X2 n=1 Tax=Antennarius striatus TaxID=241820 RepID=UPI0035B15640